MKQFILSGNFDVKDTILLTGREYHYLINVRRLSRGSIFPGIDKQGQRHTLKIRSVGNGTATAERIGTEEGKISSPEIFLIQSLVKGKKMDLILRQAAECGVKKVFPVISDHSVSRPEKRDLPAKKARWEKILREALQQSGSSVLTEIAEVSSLSEVLQNLRNSQLGLFFHEEPLEKKGLHQYLFGNRKNIVLAIGPEGGFSKDEVDFFHARGFHSVYLGTRVLRAETAAVYAVAAVQSALLEQDLWTIH